MSHAEIASAHGNLPRGMRVDRPRPARPRPIIAAVPPFPAAHVPPSRPAWRAVPAPRLLRVPIARRRRADRRRRGVPRPARPRPARERAARPQRALDLPHGRPGRGPGLAGRGPGPVRRGSLAAGAPGRGGVVPGPAAPPFLGGLVGFLGYDLGRRFETPALDRARWTRTCRVCGSPSTTGRSPGTGGPGHAWLGGRERSTGTASALARRLDEVLARLDAFAAGRLPDPTPARASAPSCERHRPPRRSSRGRRTPPGYAGVEAVRGAIGRGDIYQANLTRRLEAPFAGDPWPLFRRLRTGRPGAVRGVPGPRFRAGDRRAAGPALRLAGAVPLGRRREAWSATDPIKGTRPRGRTRDEDRALARELLASAQGPGRERDDRGRPAQRPGARLRARAPSACRGSCRLERTAAVQHLVTTVTGRLRPGPRLPSTCSRPRSRAARSPARRRSGRWRSSRASSPCAAAPTAARSAGSAPTGACGSSILIRTFVADGERLTLHVGGGITWRSDPQEEWDETVAKARGPLSSIGAVEVGPVSEAGPRHVWVDGSVRPADGAHLSVFDRGFQLGDGLFETLRARGGRTTELAEHCARLRRSAEGLAIELPADIDDRLARGIADLLAAEGLDGPDGDASVRITVSRGAWRRAGCCHRRRAPRRNDRHPGLARHRRRPPATSSAASRWWPAAVRRDPANPHRHAQDHLPGGLRVRADRGPPRGRRGCRSS